MSSEENRLNKIERQRASLRKWQTAINAAKIPPSERGISRDQFWKMVALPEKASFPDIYSTDDWKSRLARGKTFVIDGDTMVDTNTPSQVRRKVGLAILQNGITYVCQHHDFYPPYGLYADYRTVVGYLINKDRCYEAVDTLAEQHILFISEIFPDPSLNEVVRSMLTFRMDDMMRRRRDAGLVTILSFSRPCGYVMDKDKLGDEIQSILAKCHGHGSTEIEEEGIIRVVAGGKTGGRLTP